jgi:hypothetical protein
MGLSFTPLLSHHQVTALSVRPRFLSLTLRTDSPSTTCPRFVPNRHPLVLIKILTLVIAGQVFDNFTTGVEVDGKLINFALWDTGKLPSPSILLIGGGAPQCPATLDSGLTHMSLQLVRRSTHD